MKKLLRYVRWFVVLIFASTILSVIAYRFIPVPCTPLMFSRLLEQHENGESLKWHHSWVSLDDMSLYMPVAVIASEDQRFMTHHGFDVKAIETAAKEHLEGGKKLRGGSTISQQTAKNVFLWQGRSWVRKGLEAYFTFLIELFWSKSRIMEVYLNSIEMGDGIYGVEAVAQHHFGKTAKELSRSECALIAATLPNPRRYDSGNPSSFMRKRQAWIQRQMKHIDPIK